MADLIDRQAAIDAIGRDPMGGLNYERILKYLPTAESKTGEWKPYPIADGCIQCSVCGILRIGEPSNFCPNCGTMMKGEDNEAD